MFKTGLAASLAALTMMAAPAAFAADQSSILVLDRGRLIAQSAAGKSLQAQLETIGKGVDAELQPEAKGLQTELDALQASAKGKTVEQLKADAALKTKRDSFNTRMAAFEQKRAKRAQEMVATQNKADEDFEKAAQPILGAIIKERGGTLVVDKQDVVFADPKIDITQDAITKMDATVKTITVTKVNLPDKPAGK